MWNFNPRSRVGNDECFDVFVRAFVDFNPRSRVGNDAIINASDDDYNISIHVPAWGTTSLKQHSGKCMTISIHVPAWGTTFWQIHCPRSLRFQSTFPRGERPRKDTVRFILDNFNPRSRVGNDNCRTKRRRVCARFQSTFPRGERLLLRRRCLKNSVFQSTFPRGERRKL